MKLLNEVSEGMFNRKVLNYMVEQKGVTPTRADLQQKIATAQKTKPELVVVKSINAVYGTTSFEVEAIVYENAESYKLFVPKYLAKKSEIKAPEEEAKEE